MERLVTNNYDGISNALNAVLVEHHMITAWHILWDRVKLTNVLSSAVAAIIASCLVSGVLGQRAPWADVNLVCFSYNHKDLL